MLCVLFVCFVFVRTLVYSPFGQSLTGIRENMLRMHAVGAPVRWRLVACYTISAALAGIAGGLYAQANAFVNLGTLGLDRAATVLIILVLGGYGRLYGAFIGAVAYMALSHFLAKVYPHRLAARPRPAAGADRAVRAQRHARLVGPAAGSCFQRASAVRHDRRRCSKPARSSKNFGALAAARDINFRLEAGARHALIGPNGAGKTTFINLLTGVFLPTLGQVLLKGQRHHRHGAGRARQARHRPHLPDQPAVPRALGAGERLHRGGRAARRRQFRCSSRPACARTWSRRRCGSSSCSSSPNDAEHRISELPYGRQRLVELAIALGLDPEVLLLDEPAAGVPIAESHIILDAVAALPKEIGVLIIDHDMDLVFRFAQRITVLVGGAIFAEGTPKEIGADQRVRDVYLGQAHHG